MIIILSPQGGFIDDVPPTVSGDTITYQGVTYDFSDLLEGETRSMSMPIIGDVVRFEGKVRITFLYRYSFYTSIDNQPVTWDAYTFDVEEGQCPDPIIRR